MKNTKETIKGRSLKIYAIYNNDGSQKTTIVDTIFYNCLSEEQLINSVFKCLEKRKTEIKQLLNNLIYNGEELVGYLKVEIEGISAAAKQAIKIKLDDTFNKNKEVK